MKKLTDTAKLILTGIIAAVVAVITFIFGEKKSINKHFKLIALKKRRRGEAPLAFEAWYPEEYIQNNPHFFKGFSRKIYKKAGSKTITKEYRFKGEDPYFAMYSMLDKHGAILEEDEERGVIIGAVYTDAGRSKPAVVRIIVDDETLAVSALSATMKIKESKKALKLIEKAVKRRHNN